MAVESATYIGSLNSANPPANDPKKQGDDHLRMIKAVLLNSFAGFTGQIIVTGTEAQGATVNDYVVTIDGDTDPTSAQDKMLVVFKATHTNTGACSFTINSVASTSGNFKSIRSEALGANAIVSGDIAIAVYDSGSSTWKLASVNDYVPRAGAATITGTWDMSGATLTLPASLALPGSPTTTTQTAGTNNTTVATTAFVVSAVLGASVTIPGQTGMGGLAIVTDGSSANWGIGPTALPLMLAGIV